VRRFAVVLFLFAASCKSSADRANDVMEKSASWAATVRLVSSCWRGGTIPPRYTQQTLETASDELKSAGKEARKVADPATIDLVNRLTEAVLNLSRAVDAGDRAAAAREEPQLTSLERSLRRRTPP
jgi:hypothetical protein